jgi:NADPH-dependent glutamate synthase beta subunit-like oxidoreductase
MEKDTLREWERKCIQEEAPWCIAACPLHVDARGFIREVRDGRWTAARKLLEKAMPLPGILGRICDHPCQDRCKRNEAGGAIAIGSLERAVVERTENQTRIRALPKRNLTVGVFGGGLSALTAAWDLGRKGYAVELNAAADRLGGDLLQLDETLLPPEVIPTETALFEKLDIRIATGVPLTAERFAELRKNVAAVYVGLDAASPPETGLDLSAAPPAMSTSTEGVFAGGFPRGDGSSSPVWNAAEGRWAATSIDRYLQKTSPTAGREKEGPQETRLFTSLRGVASEPPIPMTNPPSYAEEEARTEAARCLQCECLECVKICPYLEHYQSYPRQYARQIYNNSSIVRGERKANLFVNTCSLCRLCEEVCPEHFSMADLVRGERREMVGEARMPPSAHEFALEDMAFANGDRLALARHAPGTDAGAYLFFPGCQLAASAPGQVEKAYAWLRETLEGGVGLLLRCCGAPADWAARDGLAEEALAAVRSEWESMGQPRMIVACTSCLALFREKLPDLPAATIWDVMAEHGLPADAPKSAGAALAISDPCSARYDADLQKTVRGLMEKLGRSVSELETGGHYTECCGFGGLMENANPAVADKVIARRAEQTDDDVLAYCAMCRDRLAGIGKRAVHLLDLIWPEAPEPADRARPGWSARRENRETLRERLLAELWEERSPEMEESRKRTLHIAPEVRARLEKRRILDEDIQRVIHHAETGTPIFKNPKTGRFLAYYRPRNVTFWVEYVPAKDGGYTVFNAYGHRMEIVGEAGK